MKNLSSGSNWYSGLASLFLISALGAGFSQAYRQALNDLFYAFSTEEYSYLLIAFVVLVVTAISLSRAEILNKPRISRILIALIYFASSGILWSLSTTMIENAFVLRMASLVVFIWGLVVSLYSVEGLKTLFYFLFTSLFMIPVPRDLLEKLAVHLSKNVGFIASVITGSKLVVEGARTFLDYGSGRFELVYGCSGIIGLSSIIALVPLLLYITKDTVSLKRRVLAVILGICVGGFIAYLGNILRISTLVWIARERGLDAALEFFHAVSSLIYASIATIASIIVALKIAKPLPMPKKKTRQPTNSGTPRAASTIMFFTVIVVVSLVLFSYIAPYTVPRRAELKLYSYNYVINNMGHLVFSNNTELVYSRPVPALERVLGSSIVEEVRIRYKGRTYDGYIEFAETPARFHSWWVCLTYQGYKILSMWRNIYNDTIIVYILYQDKIGNKHLMAYTVYTIPMYFGGVISEGYLRISLFEPTNIAYLGMPTNSFPEQLNVTVKRLSQALIYGVSKELRTLAGEEGLRAHERTLYIRIYYTILAVVIVYYALSYIYTALHNLYRRITTHKGIIASYPRPK